MTEQADGKLKEIYKRLSAPGSPVDHMLTIHSLWPHNLEGYMPLGKNVLHHSNNSLPKRFLETIGI